MEARVCEVYPTRKLGRDLLIFGLMGIGKETVGYVFMKDSIFVGSGGTPRTPPPGVATPRTPAMNCDVSVLDMRRRDLRGWVEGS